MTVVPIVIGVLDTVTKGLVEWLEDLEMRGWVETIQTTALLRLARILRKVKETWEDMLSLKLQWKTSADIGVKNSHMRNIKRVTKKRKKVKEKRTCRIVNFVTQRVTEWNQRKRKKSQVPRSCQRTKKTMKHEGDGDIDCNWCARNNPPILGKRNSKI